MQITRHDVPVSGGSLAAFEMGSAVEGAPVVIAMHGITGNSHYWLGVARALDDGVRFVAPDLRGRGASRDLGGPFGQAAHAADVLAVLDHLGAERAVVAGHSLGAYVTASVAAEHPDRVAGAVLVDGGLRIPGTEDADPQAFLEAFLGPTLARLSMRFASLEAYLEFWRAHPAFAGKDIDEEDLVAFARHDLTGEAPELRSTVAEQAVRGDAAELHAVGEAARRLSVPAVLLVAPRGLQDNPQPMQPLDAAEAWAAAAPDQRRAVLVPDTNHYTIVLGPGREAVAQAIQRAAAAPPAIA
ncbi:MAG TPA: alpha/beta hydrolase [Baekduia sp.]|nr:alpha/beta hydrolase [Baekduia sp.]